MLTQARDREELIARLVGDPVRGFTSRNFCHSGEGGWKPVVLVDDARDPQVLIAHAGANFSIYGAIERYQAVMDDLLNGRVEQEGGWPDERMTHDWKQVDGRRYMFVNASPYVVWRAALDVGFEPDAEDLRGHVAFMWHVSGAPRFGHLVQHPCRVGHGRELLELLKQGIGYDREGHYITQCLDHGPSFVCEVDGVPVCWSSTHMNGTMGMIYTPPELRRHGYARSLAAFQLDHMLARDGLACCHIIDKNVASMSMIRGFGAQRWEEPVVWRNVYWPGEAPPPGQPHH